MKVQLGDDTTAIEVDDAVAIRFAADIVRETARSRGVAEDYAATMRYSARDLDEIAEELDGTAERDAQIEELARELFTAMMGPAGIEWPNSMYVDYYRDRARKLWNLGWRKGDTGAA